MKTFNLADFTGNDDRARFADALDALKAEPGSTLIVPPGVYNITTPLSREIQAHVMNGDYGSNPEPIMFNPNFKYDCGLDFSGHKNSTVIAPEGATLMIDGFMEPISIKDCEGVTVDGFTVDHKRRPYSKGVLTFDCYDEEDDEITYYHAYFNQEITPNMPIPRVTYYLSDYRRFEPTFPLLGWEYIDSHNLRIKTIRGWNGLGEEGRREIYLWHTFHSRPVVLIERAKDTVVRNITIHSAPGMGITAMHAENILVERLRIIPAVGEHMSTNTDATHFASCRGLLRLDGCEFDGQGDDSLNVHTYYYTPERLSARKCRLRVEAPTGTHTQSVDHPETGDRLELVDFGSLVPMKTYKALSVEVDYEGRFADVEVDEDLPDSFDGYLICDPDEVPDVEFVNCHAHNHFARSILIKSRRALIENCTVTDVYDVAVKVAAEAGWREGINTEDVTIRGCRFINNGRTNRDCGGISVTMDTETPDSLPQGRVTITDNIIECPYSDFAIVVKRTKEANIFRNELLSVKSPAVYIGSPDTVVNSDIEIY